MRDVSGNLRIGAVVLVLLALGGIVGQLLSHQRESKAFYRWIQAAATNERILKSRAAEYDDDALFEETRTVAEPFLSTRVSVPSDSMATGGLLGETVANIENNGAVWDFARSAEAAGLRERFLERARANKLLFARNLDYADAQARNVSLFNMFFGFRKIAANLLWIEVDRNYRIGQVHRVIPMMKTVTALDPNFVDAYLIGAWHLAYNVTAKMSNTPPALLKWNEAYQACVGDKEAFYYEAAEFLKDGIRNNPRNYNLYFDLGFGIYHEKIEDYPNAVLYLREATRQPHERWVPRMLNRALENNGQFQEAIDGWNEYKRNHPGTGFDTADRFILRNQGRLEERNGDDLMKQAAAQENPEQRSALQQQAHDHYMKAKDLYQQIDDPFADARITMMEASELAGQGRYLEATALLDNARWNSGELFTEISNIIIEYKLAGDIPLNVSERKEVIRREEGGCEGASRSFAPVDAP